MSDEEIRAHYDDAALTVYQAYPATIAEPTVREGGFPSWYRRDRMTWIKPSCLWMMYRSGWATKAGQERVLAIRISHDGFAWALGHSALSGFDPSRHPDRDTWRRSLSAPVRIQWDPERDLSLRPLSRRTIQMGLSGEAVHRFVDDWILGIEDVTGLAHRVRDLVSARDVDGAIRLLPDERPYHPDLHETRPIRPGSAGTP